MRWFLRWAGIVAAIMLAGCAHLHVSQPPGTVLTRSGAYDDFDARNPAGPVAARLAPYALLAEQAYRTDVYRTMRSHNADRRPCPDDEVTRCAGEQPDARRAAGLLADWRLIYAHDGPYGCPDGQRCGYVVPGLGVQVWVRRGSVCREAAIGFRGTVRGSVGDWISNAHWLTRSLPTPTYDEYSQVHDNAGDWIARIRRQPCYRPGITRIVTLGHSLGGGLAQHAAFAGPGIDRVYGFDPSFVTGYYDRTLKRRDRAVRGLLIERAYEHGEILAFGYYIVRQFNPPTACNPTIVNIRFNVLRGSPVSQHSLSDFTTGLLRESRGVAAAPDRFAARARACAAADGTAHTQ